MVALVLLVLAVLANGCTRDEQRRATSSEGQPEARSANVATCATAMQGKDYCVVVARGDLQVRYAYVPAVENENSLTLVDRGGPGASLFGPMWPGELVTALQEADPHTGLLFLEEPWVTRRPSPACREAATAWNLAFRGDRQMGGPARDLVARCRLDSDATRWGWTPPRYRSAVAAVEDDVGRRATRFVGASFAGVRLSYLDRRWERVALVSPLPPGVPVDDYLSTRQHLLDEALDGCPLCAGPESTHVAGRSIPVTGFDRASAMVAAGYLAPGEAARATQVIGSGTALSDVEHVGRLSDSATGRIGIDDLSPAVLAIWSEQCRSMAPGARARAGRGYFDRYFSPCAFIAAEGRPVSLDSDETCVSLARHDPVVPVALSRSAYSSAGTTLRRFRGAHASVQGLAACL